MEDVPQLFSDLCVIVGSCSQFLLCYWQLWSDIIRPRLLPHQMGLTYDSRDVNPDATPENTFLPSDVLDFYQPGTLIPRSAGKYRHDSDNSYNYLFMQYVIYIYMQTWLSLTLIGKLLVTYEMTAHRLYSSLHSNLTSLNSNLIFYCYYVFGEKQFFVNLNLASVKQTPATSTLHFISCLTPNQMLFQD